MIDIFLINVFREVILCSKEDLIVCNKAFYQKVVLFKWKLGSNETSQCKNKNISKISLEKEIY